MAKQKDLFELDELRELDQLEIVAGYTSPLAIKIISDAV